MQKLVYSFFLLLNCIAVSGQGSGLNFAQSTGSYTAITGGTVLVSGTFDNTIYMIELPAAFMFKGVSYLNATVCTNGWVALGTNSLTATNFTPLSSTAVSPAFISPFGMDLNNAASGSPELRYVQTGNEIVFQWQDVKRFTAVTNTEKFSFQLRLNTSNGVIQFVYGDFQNTTTSLTSPQVGIRAASNAYPANIYNRLVNTTSPSNTWDASIQGTANTSTCRFTSAAPAASPASGQTYTWTPVDCSALTCTNNISPANSSTLNSTSATLSWSSVSGAYAYKLYFGSNLPLPQIGTFTVTSTTLTNLADNTTYSWYIVPAGFSCTVSGCESTMTSFNTGCLINTCVTNISPANASTSTTSAINLSWNSSPGATLYDVYLGTSNPPTTVIKAVTTTNTTLVLPNNTYYWYVLPRPHCMLPAFCNGNTTSFTIANSTMAANDICATATDLIGVLGTASSFTNASFEINNGCQSPTNKDVWFRFKPLTSTASVSVVGGGTPCFDPSISVYSGNCQALTCIGSDDAGSCTSVNTVNLAGLDISAVYFVKISTFDAAATSGQFTLTGTNIVSAPLPLNFTAFTARVHENSIKLKWNTAQEQNSRHFIIERSYNGTGFSAMGQVVAANSSGSHEYTFTDQSPLQGTNFYRIRQVDIDGRFTFSKILRVDMGQQSGQLKLWPNPAGEKIEITFNSTKSILNIMLYDLTGRIILTKQVSNLRPLELPVQLLAPGAYYIRVSDGDTNASSPFIKR